MNRYHLLLAILFVVAFKLVFKMYSVDDYTEEEEDDWMSCRQVQGRCYGYLLQGQKVKCDLISYTDGKTGELLSPTCITTEAYPGECQADKCVQTKLHLPSVKHSMGWLDMKDKVGHFLYDEVPIKAISSSEKAELEPYLKRLEYWNRADVRKNYRRIIPRYLSTKIHYSGFNNRRMSLEVAYALAYVMNRTLILQPPHPLAPFSQLGLEEKMWDLDGMKSGWPTLTYDEFEQRAKITQNPNLLEPTYLNWDKIPNNIFAVPSLPSPSSVEYTETYTKWRHPRGPEAPITLNEIDSHHHQHIYINQDLFCQFYVFIYPSLSSSIKQESILRLIRDHFHFKKEIFEWAAKVLKEMPECFSTFHIRRGDLDYPTAKLTPREIYLNSHALLHDGETVYIATDDPPEKFKKTFLPVFQKRYKVVQFHHYEHLLKDMDPKWIPMVEMLLCSQGRVFIGTHFSTFTAYIHRLRGYMPTVPNTKFYFTSQFYNTPDEHQEEHSIGWDREYARGFDPIRSDLSLSPLNCPIPEPKQAPESIPLDPNWNLIVPRWSKAIEDTTEYIKNIQSKPQIELTTLSQLELFTSYFLMPKNSNPVKLNIPEFPDLEKYLQMLRDNERNMFISVWGKEGYVLESSSSEMKVAVKINVIWESPGLVEGEVVGVYGAMTDTGFLVLTVGGSAGDGDIKDFTWVGLQLPPKFDSFFDFDPVTKEKPNVGGLPTVFSDCEWRGRYAFLSKGLYDYPWLSWWKFKNEVSSLDATNCFSITLWNADGLKFTADNVQHKCLVAEETTKWINDRSHSIFVGDSEDETNCKKTRSGGGDVGKGNKKRTTRRRRKRTI